MHNPKASLSLGEIYTSAVERLSTAGVETPHIDVGVLLAAGLGIGRERILTQPHTLVPTDYLDSITAMITRRTQREPVSRILGRRSFWSIDVRLTPDVFDPRPDSETLIATALDYPHRLDYVLDLGTGSGCLLLAVLKERPEAKGLGIDIDPEAITVATLNATRLGIVSAYFAVCNWTKAVGQTFDLILCNPPYLKTHDIAYLAPEVTLYDPFIALCGGEDGLDAYRLLAPQIGKLLTKNGWAILEIDDAMKHNVSDILINAALDIQHSVHDLRGRERCIVVGHRQ